MNRKMTVDWRDGWLCVHDTDDDFSTPTRTHTWWPVRQVPRSDAEPIIGREAFEGRPGSYSARTAPYPAGYWVELPLLAGGQTRPLATATEPIPQPRVRKGIETRYRTGRWEKYLKASGWVTA
jgi:hypothetical protein